MFEIPNQLAPLLQNVPAWLPLLGLLGVSLALIFAGRTVVKVAAFLIVGVAGALVGGMLGAHYIPAGGDLIGVVIGFVLGGLLGVALVALGIGLVVGYSAYLLAQQMAFGDTVSLILGLAFFVVGVALSGKILALVTAVGGGLLLFDVLILYGFGPTVSTLLAALATLAGLWVQLSQRRHAPQPTATQQMK